MKKIMFNDKYGLTDAVIHGRKTMTRRVIKDKELIYSLQESEHFGGCFSEDNIRGYKVGDVVAVAQSYKDAGFSPNDSIDYIDYGGNMYGPLVAGDVPGWNNKMFVKAELMPHSIRITDIKIERLHDISYEDCMKEGIFDTMSNRIYHYRYPNSPRNYINPREAFASLIDKVSGRGTWDSNPWVFAYSFELID